MMLKRKRTQTAWMLVAIASLLTTSVNAAIVVTPDHITSGSATGTLLAVDVPYVGTSGFPYTGGPTWTHPADTGFETETTGINEVIGTNDGSWEPDGTPFSQNPHYNTYSNGSSPDVSYTFNVPDGSVIHAIYATWRTRGSDGGVYSYTEGLSSGTSPQVDHAVLPANNLSLKWIDDVLTERTAPFQRIFSGPINVIGGNGFTLFLDDNSLDNAMSIDAVVIDFTAAAVPEPASVAIWFLLGLGLAGFGYYRSRRKN